MREKSQRWLSLWTTTVAGALITNQKAPPCALLDPGGVETYARLATWHEQSPRIFLPDDVGAWL